MRKKPARPTTTLQNQRSQASNRQGNAIPSEQSQPLAAVNDDIPVMPVASNNMQPQAATSGSYAAGQIKNYHNTIGKNVMTEKVAMLCVCCYKFPIEIDNPDIPFALLDQSQQRIYVAQSGLIGADGTDSNGERPLFSSERSYVLDQGDQVVCRCCRIQWKMFRLERMTTSSTLNIESSITKPVLSLLNVYRSNAIDYRQLCKNPSF